MHIPGGLHPRLGARDLEHVQTELAQEKAAALGRAASRLQQALARLEELGSGESDSADPRERTRLVLAAGEALWGYVVQREACGFQDTEFVLREFRVPAEVRLRMGPALVMQRCRGRP